MKRHHGKLNHNLHLRRFCPWPCLYEAMEHTAWDDGCWISTMLDLFGFSCHGRACLFAVGGCGFCYCLPSLCIPLTGVGCAGSFCIETSVASHVILVNLAIVVLQWQYLLHSYEQEIWNCTIMKNSLYIWRKCCILATDNVNLHETKVKFNYHFVIHYTDFLSNPIENLVVGLNYRTKYPTNGLGRSQKH